MIARKEANFNSRPKALVPGAERWLFSDTPSEVRTVDTHSRAGTGVFLKEWGRHSQQCWGCLFTPKKHLESAGRGLFTRGNRPDGAKGLVVGRVIKIGRGTRISGRGPLGLFAGQHANGFACSFYRTPTLRHAQDTRPNNRNPK